MFLIQERIFMEKCIHIKNGQELIHYRGPFQGDVALCGHDLAGDSIHGDSWDRAEYTNRRVNCRECLIIMHYVRGSKC